MSCAAVIVAAGSGRRMGFDKLTAKLGGTSVLQRSLEVCLATPGIEQVVVVAPPERFATLRIEGPVPVRRADGGTERYQSVINGLELLAPLPELVAIHDGARPLVTPEQIGICLALARESGAAALAHRLTETLKRCDPDGLVTESVDREGLWAMETPQIFRHEIIRRAYEEVTARGLHVTDDVSAAELIGAAATLVENPRPNPKITVPRDLAVAEALLRPTGS